MVLNIITAIFNAFKKNKIKQHKYIELHLEAHSRIVIHTMINRLTTFSCLCEIAICLIIV